MINIKWESQVTSPKLMLTMAAQLVYCCTWSGEEFLSETPVNSLGAELERRVETSRDSVSSPESVLCRRSGWSQRWAWCRPRARCWSWCRPRSRCWCGAWQRPTWCSSSWSTTWTGPWCRQLWWRAPGRGVAPCEEATCYPWSHLVAGWDCRSCWQFFCWDCRSLRRFLARFWRDHVLP